MRFSPVSDGTQTATVALANGGDGAHVETIIRDGRVSLGDKPEVVAAGRVQGSSLVCAGTRSSPNAEGAGNNFQWTGKDTFADKNVFAIVLEIPNSALSPNPQVGFWGRVLVLQEGQQVQGTESVDLRLEFAFNRATTTRDLQPEGAPGRPRAIPRQIRARPGAGGPLPQ